MRNSSCKPGVQFRVVEIYKLDALACDLPAGTIVARDKNDEWYAAREPWLEIFSNIREEAETGPIVLYRDYWRHLGWSEKSPWGIELRAAPKTLTCRYEKKVETAR